MCFTTSRTDPRAPKERMMEISLEPCSRWWLSCWQVGMSVSMLWDASRREGLCKSILKNVPTEMEQGYVIKMFISSYLKHCDFEYF